MRGERTRRQRAVERAYGKPLPDVIDELLYDRNLTVERAAGQLGVHPQTLWVWMRHLRQADTDSATRQQVAV